MHLFMIYAPTPDEEDLVANLADREWMLKRVRVAQMRTKPWVRIRNCQRRHCVSVPLWQSLSSRREKTRRNSNTNAVGCRRASPDLCSFVTHHETTAPVPEDRETAKRLPAARADGGFWSTDTVVRIEVTVRPSPRTG